MIKSATNPDPHKKSIAEAFVLFQTLIWEEFGALELLVDTNFRKGSEPQEFAQAEASRLQDAYHDPVWNAVQAFRGKLVRPSWQEIEKQIAQPGDFIITFDDNSRARISNKEVEIIE